MLIEVYHDTACPWCRIGKRQLALALQAWDGEPVTVRYRTFFLNDEIPPEGYDFRAYMQAKGGGNADLEMWFAAPREAGAKVGLTFNFDRITKAPNTMLSHQLIALVPEERRTAVIDAVYDAYFQHGQDIGSLDVLVSIAAANGLPEPETRAALEAGRFRQQVLDEAREGAALGVTGVPLFVFQRRYAVSGAQPADVLRSVMERVSQLAMKDSVR